MLPGDLLETKRKTRINRLEDKSNLNRRRVTRPIVFTSYKPEDDCVDSEWENINNIHNKCGEICFDRQWDVIKRETEKKNLLQLDTDDHIGCDVAKEIILTDKDTLVKRRCKFRTERCNSTESYFSEKEFLSSQKISQEYYPGYVPSWLSTDEENDMDASSLKSFETLTIKHSRSLTDLRQPGTVQRKPKARSDNADKYKHQKIEQEYFRLKKRLNLNNDGAVTSNHSLTTAQSHNRVNLSDTAVPNYRELLESDELGINHFRKHVHNVKVTSKKFRRAQRSCEPVKTRAPPKRRQFNFKPLYEHIYSEDTVGTSNSFSGIM